MVLAAMVYFAEVITAFEQSKTASVAPKARHVTLPQECRKFRREYATHEWNDSTQMYPLNRKWLDCMGVGAK
ncbi:hypothetical protein MNBD_GAMMA15-1658 [hydrothermal vent metagenome]|uniref:Uncharacterized protein n=1 Tax=hydrothermal vent metagenome TaxID=652676 RepID=A0A3B0YZJ3_9ZZZZ